MAVHDVTIKIGIVNQATAGLNGLKTALGGLSTGGLGTGMVFSSLANTISGVGAKFGGLGIQTRTVTDTMTGMSQNVGQAGVRMGGFSATTQTAIGSVGMLNMGMLAASVTFGVVKTGISAVVSAVTALYDGFKAAAIIAGDFEQGMALVQKTTRMSDEEMAKLEASLFRLGRVSSMPVIGLQAVAQTAGQLGIKGTEDISSFTMTVVKSAAAFDMTAAKAAEGLAKIRGAFREQFGASIGEIEKLASAMNELEDTSAARARDITAALTKMSLAPALKITAQDAAALSTAIIETGLAGSNTGTLMNSFFGVILKDMEKVARVAGMTGAEFKKALGEDAVGAILKMVDNIRNTEDRIGILSQVADAFGKRGVKIIVPWILNFERLNERLELSRQGYDENVSVTNAWKKTQDTFNASLGRFQNSLYDVTNTLGKEYLPVLTEIVNRLPKFVDAMSDLAKSFGIGEMVRDFLVVIRDLLDLVSSSRGQATITQFASLAKSLWVDDMATFTAKVGAFGSDVDKLSGTLEAQRISHIKLADVVETDWEAMDALAKKYDTTSGVIQTLIVRTRQEKISFEDVTKALEDGIKPAEALSHAKADMAIRSAKASEKIKEEVATQKSWESAAESVIKTTGDLSKSWQENTASVEKMRKVQSDYTVSTGKIKALEDSMVKTRNSAIAQGRELTDAERQYVAQSEKGIAVAKMRQGLQREIGTLIEQEAAALAGADKEKQVAITADYARKRAMAELNLQTKLNLKDFEFAQQKEMKLIDEKISKWKSFSDTTKAAFDYAGKVVQARAAEMTAIMNNLAKSTESVTSFMGKAWGDYVNALKNPFETGSQGIVAVFERQMALQRRLIEAQIALATEQASTMRYQRERAQQGLPWLFRVQIDGADGAIEELLEQLMSRLIGKFISENGMLCGITAG